MSDIPKPYFMFNKDDEDESRLNRIIDRIDAQLKSYEEADEDDDDFDDKEDYPDDSNYTADNAISDPVVIDKQFEYINEQLSVFPECASLLWNAVNLAVAKHRPILADEYFRKLSAIPIKKHDFDTIVSEIKYLLCDPFGRAAQIRKYVRFLQRKYPSREEGIYYEGILEERMGNSDKSISLFKKAVEEYKRAPKSAERLANIMLDSGEYEEVLNYVKLADMMSTSKDKIVNMSDLSFNLCLAKDSLLKQRDIEGKKITTDEIDDLRRSYEKLKMDYSELKDCSILQERIDKLNSMKSEIEK